VPVAVLADANGSTPVLGDITESISIAAPSTMDLDTLVAGGTKSYSTDQTITVSANNSTRTVSVTVRDTAQETTIGQMKVGAHTLATVLKVKGQDIASYTALPSEAVTVSTLEDSGAISAGTYTITDFNVQQQVLWTDTIDADYTLTLYFVASYV